MIFFNYDNIKYKLKIFPYLIVRSGFKYFRTAMIHSPYAVSMGKRKFSILDGSNGSSVGTYLEVVIEDCYNLLKYRKVLNPRVIVDIGANIGMFSKMCAEIFPQAIIYAYEPNSRPFLWLKKNSENSNIIPNQTAILDKEKSMNIRCGRTTEKGRLSNKEGIPIRTLNAAKVADGKDIDLLKMDCEGSEWEILKDFTLLKRTKHLVMEFHLEQEDQNLGKLKKMLSSADHKIIRTKMKNHFSKEHGNKYGILWSRHI